MSAIDKIRRYVSELPPDKLFTTRDFLNFGPRTAIDSAVYELVKTKEIIRVVRGVFKSPHREEPVGLLEVATVKAESFGRKIITYARDAAIDLGLLMEEDPSMEFFLATNGRTSSFRFGRIKIHFRGTSPRRMALGDSRVGQAIRALCYLGQSKVSEGVIEFVAGRLSESELRDAGSLCASMPWWLSSFFCAYFAPFEIRSIVIYGEGSAPRTVEEIRGVYSLPYKERSRDYLLSYVSTSGS